MKTSFQNRRKNQSGFIIADFIFSFVLVLAIGIFIFALTFSLATLEISQYIVWSAARAYASGNLDESSASSAAKSKFDSLSAQFPLLTGNGNASPWYLLDGFLAQDFGGAGPYAQKTTDADRANRDGNTEKRQPWTGASAKIYLKLFSNMSIPFLGRVSKDPDLFTFRLYAFIIRNPSYDECTKFFEKRFDETMVLDTFPGLKGALDNKNYLVEDNGC